MTGQDGGDESRSPGQDAGQDGAQGPQGPQDGQDGAQGPAVGQGTQDRASGHAIARSPAVWALALGQTLGYASLFYIFAALILSWQSDLGWDNAVLATGPMLAIVIAAVLAPFSGRLVDRGHGPELLAGGGLVGAAGLCLLAMAQGQGVYLAAWAILGVAQATCLYETCFAFLIRRLGPDARAAIVRVTLVAGLASTLAFPAGAALSAALGWRGAVWVAAATVAFVMVPLHHFGAGAIRRAGPPPVVTSREDDREGLARALRRPAFWLLATAFALVGLNHWMLVNFLVPIFVEQGLSPVRAVLAASLVGPSQVAGRLVLLRFEARIGTAAATRITLTSCIAATLFLWASGLAPVLVFAFAILQGAALGVVTILRPVMIAEALGQAGYGAIAGVIQIPGLVASALAPMLGALMLGGPGLPWLLALSLALSAAAYGAILALRRVP